ncbi:MAG TPA: SpoIIE family protein phosphatase [Bacteroidales bacterium]|nr:SpoIIE family protein phosphatase [Bacteroidales bacterium]
MKIIASLFLLFISTSYTVSQSSGFKINYYSPKDYGIGREATNYACVQDRNGILYFGNAGGLLQYNGNSWSYIPVKNQSLWIKAIAVSDENVIYAGALGEFGYLQTDETGKLNYVSISDQLTGNLNFSDIIRVWAVKNRVFFQYEEALFIYSGGELKSVLPETSFHISFIINDELFIRQRGIGIMKMEEDSLHLVKGSEFLKDFGVFSMLESQDKNRYLFITHEDGLWSLDKITSEYSLLKTDEIIKFSYGAIRLTDGRIAINTLTNGIIITDENFNVLTIINRNSGLKVNSVLSLMQDYQGNLWACTDNGVDQICYSSPVSLYGPEAGITGNINSIVRYKKELFLGTTDGLFILNQRSRDLSSTFIPYSDIYKEVRSLCLADESLLVNTGNELYEIKNNEIKKVATFDINALHYSQKLKILFISVRNRFLLYRYSGNWKKIMDIPEITEDIVRIEESDDPELTTLWMGTSTDGIVRMKFTDPSNYKVDKYHSADGLAEQTWVLPFSIDNKILFSQSIGLLSFVDEKIIQAQLPDSLKNIPEFYRGYFEFSELGSSKEIIGKPLYFAEDTWDRIYVNLDGDLGYFDKRNDYSFERNAFALSYIGKINVILHENNGICWIGGDDGLLRYNEKGFKDYSVDFTALITRVTCGSDSVLSFSSIPATGSGKKIKITETRPIVKYKQNTLTFDFAAPFFEGQERTLFSYMLYGQDTAYSHWSEDNRIVFSNLRERDYKFFVKARNIYNHVSNEQVFSFTVLPPWYRTTWAYLLYVILISVFIYVAIKINTRRLIAINKKLEKTIAERTHEIQEKNIVLEVQKKEIVDSINYAQRIQNAVLPNESLMQEYLGDHFIIYRPKDIVSGDFYWVKNLNQYTVFCVADCTGHGVPGAFMSMLCLSFLDEVVMKEGVIHPEVVLNRVRNMVIESLKQKGAMWEQKDGMDISICFYNRETSIIEFAGANNPVYIVRKIDQESLPSAKRTDNGKYVIYEIKGDQMTVSFSDLMEPYTRHSVNIHKDDRIYLFSDGICDQFGGPEGKRFMYNSLRTVILETISPDIRNQKSKIEERLDEWKAYINPKTGCCYEQIDDICLMGIKI